MENNTTKQKDSTKDLTNEKETEDINTNPDIKDQYIKDFPILSRKVNDHNLVYLDSSATSLTPIQVVEKMDAYYNEARASIHRGVYYLSCKATEMYEDSRRNIAEFINALPEEVVFTSGTTEGLNLIARSICKNLKEKDEILLTEMEHHSNIVPWQIHSKKRGIKIKYTPITFDGRLDINEFERMLHKNKKIKVISLTHASNVLGSINNIKIITKVAKSYGVIVIIDGAQSVPHIKIDVKEIGCDFLVFSGHKMCGPTGIGILYGKKEMLENIEPLKYGGGMISTVTKEETTLAELPQRLEGGTPNIAGVIGLSEAVNYIKKIGFEKIEKIEKELTKYALDKLEKLEYVTVYPPLSEKERIGVISFNIKDLHPHDVASILDRYGIAVRAGNHCAMPLMKVLGINGTVRVSFYFYNTVDDVDKLIEGIIETKKFFDEKK